MRAQFTGANPTTIRMRAWADGGTEPTTWQYTATNSAAALQVAGGVGLRSYLGSGATNAPFVVTVDDLSATSIGGGTNTAPVVDTVTVTPASPTTGQTVTANVTSHDADGNPLTTSYQWTRNGTDIAGATSSTLNLATAGNGDRGDLIRVIATVNDGTVNSAPVTSSPVTVVNTAPVATVGLAPSSPTTTATLTATATRSDADADAISLTYVWRVNGTVRRTANTTALTDTFDLSVGRQRRRRRRRQRRGHAQRRHRQRHGRERPGHGRRHDDGLRQRSLLARADQHVGHRQRRRRVHAAGHGGRLRHQRRDRLDRPGHAERPTAPPCWHRCWRATSTSATASRLDKVPTGGSLWSYGLLRRINATNEYRASMRFAPGGGVFISASTVINGAEVGIGSEVRVTALTATPGAFFRVRAQFSGANPTSIRMRAWADGTTEPTTWQYTVTNAAAALQVAGAVGLRSYLGSAATNAPITVTVDDLAAISIAGP